MTFKNSILLAGLMMASASFAQNTQEKHPPKNPEQIMKDLDKDKDGLISYKEAKGPLKDGFKTVDLDQDGFVNMEELQKAPKPKHPPKQGANPQR
ncbi:MAG: EF-hand domain-containing protein [Crocinitomicaceae bacterium]